MTIRRIAVFASGSGTNAQNIFEYFSENLDIKVECLLSNSPNSYALTRASLAGIETFIFNRQQLYESSAVEDYLASKGISLIVLAGFLWLVPPSLIRRFTIINIHPALLPKYGGKNMYGRYVHEAVIENGEKESGITIHFVNERYDDGAIIFQDSCDVRPGDTPETLAERIHELEYRHFPRIIEQVAKGLK